MTSRPPSRIPVAFAAAFFLSGAAALVYELLWFRLLSHVLGSTATATATLLASYLFGLGIGAWLFGWVSDRTGPRAARIYALLEAGIGIYGLASHALFAAGAGLYAFAHGWSGGSPGRLLAGRFAVSFLLVVLPTALMGGTFPLMVRLLQARGAAMGRAAGMAYAANTAGAALGALALPFLLLPWLGVAWSLAAAAAANGLAALLVFLAARERTVAAAATGDMRVAEEAEPLRLSPSRGSSAALIASFFLSSFAALVLETVWTRHLGLFFGTKIHVFAFVLFGYLVGLFLGGSLYARLSARGRRPSALLHGGLFAAAVGTALPIPLLDRLSIPQVELMMRAGVSHGSFLATTGIVTLALVLVPAIGFGVAFPAVVDLLFRTGRRAGASVGAAYVVNTLGTTLGAPVAGFFLVPRYGSQRALEISALLIAAALAIAPGTPGRRTERSSKDAPPRPDGGFAIPRPLWRYLAAAAFPILFLLPRWDWRLAHSQYVKDPPGFVERYKDGTLWPIVVSYDIEYLKEGAEATVSVCRFSNGSRSLYVNGKADASNILVDMVVQRLLGVVPALFHPAPKRALVIGVGSGTTVAMLHRFGIPEIDAAEISPEVAEAARRYFEPINEGALDAPGVTVRLDDGRNFLHFQPPESYDIIVSEPSNPWMAGVSALFTDEFFAEVAAKLRPGGVACQWFHLYTMSPEHVRLLVRTFQGRFPQSAIFLTRSRQFDGDMIMIGCKGPLRLARLPDDAAVPARIKLALSEVLNAGNAAILSGLAAGPAEAAQYGGTGRINTDDRPVLELEAPADLFHSDPMRTIASLIGSHAEVFLPAGPTAAESPAAVEIARDGFASGPGPRAGKETLRGATVLTKLPLAAEPLRWVLLGREIDDDVSTTGLYWLVRPLGVDDETGLIARTLAGAGSSPGPSLAVNGHEVTSALFEEGGRRTIVLGWPCPVRRRAFFIRARVGASDVRPPETIAEELLRRHPCDHTPR